MKDRSTKGTLQFLFDTVCNLIIMMAVYKNILFRCLPGMTYTASMVILCGMCAGFALAGIFLLYRFRRTGWTAVLTVLFPYGLYTAAAYKNAMKNFLIVVIGITVIFTAIYMLLSLRGALKALKRYPNRRHLRGNCLYKCFMGMQSFAGIAFIVIMGTLAINGIFGTGLFKASVQASVGNGLEEQTIKKNIGTLKLMQEEEWAKLTVQQRLDVLQTVANIEAYYLGLSNELNVGSANLDEDVLGCYSDNTHTITISIDHLENDPVYEVLDTCCHEAYHSYEHCLVEAYNSADEALKSLRIYKNAKTYAEEFSDYEDNYENSYEDFCLYYYQDCESDAREYAETAVYDYGVKIQEYLDEEEEEA